MKTSFYFVLWILIYPILGLLNNQFINDHTFLVAFIIVYALSVLLARLMPQIHIYEQSARAIPLLENVYSEDFDSFSERLSTDSTIETITAIYFCVTALAIALIMGLKDWFALLVFGYLAFQTILRCVKLANAKASLHSNPTIEQCIEITNDTYQLDYVSYCELRKECDYTEAFPPKPKHFKAFQILSFVIACVAIILGIAHIIYAVSFLFTYGHSVKAETVACMLFLYGSLAACFGVRDTISIFHLLRNTPQPYNAETTETTNIKSKKMKKSLYIFTLLATLFVTIICFFSCENKNIKELKKAIAEANEQCPSNIGIIGDILSIKYNEQNKEVAIYMVTNEEIVDIDAIKENQQLVMQSTALSYVKERQGFIKQLINTGVGLSITYKGTSSGKDVNIKISLEKLKEYYQTSMSDYDINKVLLNNMLIIENTSCPYAVDEDVECVNVYDEGENIVYTFRSLDSEFNAITPDMLDMMKEEMEMKEQSKDPSMKRLLGLICSLNKGLIFRFEDKKGKSIDIAFSSYELSELLKDSDLETKIKVFKKRH